MVMIFWLVVRCCRKCFSPSCDAGWVNCPIDLLLIALLDAEV